MKRTILALSAGLALVACSKDAISPAEGLLLSCKAFGDTLEILAPLRADGTLNASTVKIVESTKAGVDEVCLGKAPNVDAEVKDLIVKNGLAVVKGIALQFIVSK